MARDVSRFHITNRAADPARQGEIVLCATRPLEPLEPLKTCNITPKKIMRQLLVGLHIITHRHNDPSNAHRSAGKLATTP